MAMLPSISANITTEEEAEAFGTLKGDKLKDIQHLRSEKYESPQTDWTPSYVR